MKLSKSTTCLLSAVLLIIICLSITSCAMLVMVIPRPDDNVQIVDAWAAYYLNQMERLGPKAETPSANASEAQWKGFRIAKEEFEKMKADAAKSDLQNNASWVLYLIGIGLLLLIL